MSQFASQLREYLSWKRDLGYRGEKRSTTLRDFVRYLKKERARRITKERIVDWVTRAGDCGANWLADRFSFASDFAKYCKLRDPRTQVPPARMFAYHRHRPTPHIYSEAELRRLLKAARNLSEGVGLRPQSYATLYGLMAAAGLRPREAVRLDRDDVDLRLGILTIRESKFGKSRFVPLHRTTVRALRSYARKRDRVLQTPATTAFFVFDNGGRISYAAAYATFRELLDKTGIRSADASRGPRLHDLRHTFAVRTLIRWYRARSDVEKRLPVLATYLGHVRVAWSYWYLSAHPELLQLACSRLQQGLRELS